MQSFTKKINNSESDLYFKGYTLSLLEEVYPFFIFGIQGEKI